MSNRILVLALCSLLFVVATAEAQLFRRFRAPAPQRQAPVQRYNAPAYYQVQPTAPQRYYRPSPTSQIGQAQTSAATRDAKAGANGQAQQYRSVVVFDPRTGRRFTRLVAIPSTALAQQPYAYGQAGRSQTASPVQATGPKTAAAASAQANKRTNSVVVRPGSVARGSSTTRSASSIPASAIQLDGGIQTATFEQPKTAASSPAVAIPTQAAPSQAKPSQRPDGQYSILDRGNSSSDSLQQLELTAPEN